MKFQSLIAMVGLLKPDNFKCKKSGKIVDHVRYYRILPLHSALVNESFVMWDWSGGKDDNK